MIIPDTTEMDKMGSPSSIQGPAPVYDAPPPYDGIRARQTGPPALMPVPPPPPPPRHAPAAVPAPVQTPAPPPVPQPVHASHAVFQPTKQQLINHFSLFSKHDPISGTFLIDPHLRADAIDTNRFSDSSLRKIKRRDHREHARNARRTFGSVPESDSDSDGSHKKSCSRKSKHEVNAAFRTRHAAIKLALAVVQSGGGAATRGKDKKARGRIMLSSRHGRIDVDLFEVQENRCVDLDLSTRDGNITVFLPSTFCGAVGIRTRRGPSGVQLLPAFAERARVVRGSDREMLLVLPSSSLVPSSSTTSTAANTQEGDDYCIIGTRSGRITIGLSGLDQVPGAGRPSGAGLIKRFEALVGAGAKQFETIVETRAKEFETWVEAGAKMLETTLAGRA